MAETHKPLKSGYEPNEDDLPAIKQRYQVKNGYYMLSSLVFIVSLLGLYLTYDLKKTGYYFESLILNATIMSFYVAGIALLSVGMRLRAGFCVICKHFRLPTRLDFSDYCNHCGASLYKYDVFTVQKPEKSKHNRSHNERYMEMVKRGDLDAMRMLLFKGANVDYQDRFGNSALMNASMVGRDDVVDLLLQYQAKTELTNNFGLTALMIAVDKGHLIIVKQLIDFGVPRHGITKDGRTAMEIASNHNDQAMIDILTDS